jgi:hypothetical protein
MSSLAYNYSCFQVTPENMTEFVKIYYNAAGKEPSFMASVDVSDLLNQNFLPEASQQLYIETVRHIYWTIRIIADPDEDNFDVREYIRSFNPFFQDYNFQTQELFSTIIETYKKTEKASAAAQLLA